MTPQAGMRHATDSEGYPFVEEVCPRRPDDKAHILTRTPDGLWCAGCSMTYREPSREDRIRFRIAQVNQ